MSEPSTRAVERALILLANICDHGSMNLVESARQAELAPSTALRLLRTLENTGFIRRDDVGNFRAGSRIIQLGAQSLSSESLIDICRATMEELSATTGESVYLSVEGHARTALYIAIVEGTHSVRHTSWVGRTIPLESSAAGQVLRGSIGDAGYTVVERGVESDVTAIATPIRSNHRIIAALSIVVPSYRITDDDVARYGELLVAECTRISAGLSGADGRSTSKDTQK
ncbi:MAG TPA: IclR family transcriptional regulator C-terminal domain-containing protein [Glaciibacter sp.]|nr:IclR family transcriptional regulator C-terminal domain-containing protein [Glaciibacter sp.]